MVEIFKLKSNDVIDIKRIEIIENISFISTSKIDDYRIFRYQPKINNLIYNRLLKINNITKKNIDISKYRKIKKLNEIIPKDLLNKIEVIK